MNKPEIALQMGMVRRCVLENGIPQALLYTAQSGIRKVSLPSCPLEGNVEEIVRAEQDTGVSIIALETVWGTEKEYSYDLDLQKEELRIVDIAKRLGVEYLRIARMPEAFLDGPEAILSICREWNQLSGRLKKQGLKLAYQCHNEEFEKFNGRFILDYILEYTDDLAIELDTFWVHMGGQFADEWIRKTAGRNDLLDVQDIRIQTPKGSHLVRSLLLDDSVRFAEVGEGNLEFDKIIKEACKSGVKYICVCQEETYDHTPFESVGNNVKALHEMLEQKI
ncbi:MAG: TIM barrel protein [Clostridiales bacterium]|nr:TIM barrel protein [Clostridiales bacterium]